MTGDNNSLFPLPPLVAEHEVTATQRLLRHLRDIMGGGGERQQKLNRIVEVIAQETQSEVCSLYVRRAGDVLELFASIGLREDSVHNTRLMMGEGLVGDIAYNARSLAVSDAHHHPNYAYRPETGEEIYHSLMGVPVLHGGRVLGVLVVQNRSRRTYTSEEVEIVETIAMLVAEMILAEGVLPFRERTAVDGLGSRPLRLEGVSLSPGLALGRAVMHRPEVPVNRIVAGEGHSPEAENKRLDAALSAMQVKLDRLMEDVDGEGGDDHVDILRTIRMAAEDQGWERRIREAIATGLSAEGAVLLVQNETHTRMKKTRNLYLRERLLDLEDLVWRLLQHLSETDEEGEALLSHEGPAPQTEGDMVVIARNMGAAELLDYDRSRLKAVVLEEGSATSHVAIVARGLGIPLIGRVNRILNRAEQGDPIAVDGDNGVCFIRPGEEFIRVFSEAMEVRFRQRETWARDRNKPPVTRDGIPFTLQMNAGLLADMPHLHESGAAGIGLFRTEVIFMVRPDYPDVKEQAELYGRIMDQAGDKPITFRTLDMGGDKALPYFEGPAEENPAMGWRAIRVMLDQPIMLRQQLRALVQAASERVLRIMFPLVANVPEFLRAKELLERELVRAHQKGRKAPASVSVGVMLEVPSLVFQLPALLPHIDFLSLGTNDLLQFLFASDRGNPRMEKRYPALSPAFMNLVRQVVRQCRAAGVPLTVCGEIAGDPLHAMALAGAGIRNLSMAPWSMGSVRALIRSLSLQSLEPYVDSLLDSSAHDLTPRLLAFAKDHDIVLN